MTDKQHTAILAKNDIAREIRDFNNGEPISASKVLACLYQIEEYIGQGNQPIVDDIINESFDSFWSKPTFGAE
jgi:hypothetical protein